MQFRAKFDDYLLIHAVRSEEEVIRLTGSGIAFVYITNLKVFV